MQKSMALVGNLVSQGAGSNELRDNAFSMGGLARMAKGVAGKALGIAGSVASNTVGLAPRAGLSIAKDALSMQSRHLGARALRGLGLDGGYGKKTDQNGVEDPGGSSGAKNNEKANYGSEPNAAKNAITGEGFKRSFTGGENTNNNKSSTKKNDMVGNAISGLSNATGKKGGK